MSGMVIDLLRGPRGRPSPWRKFLLIAEGLLMSSYVMHVGTMISFV